MATMTLSTRVEWYFVGVVTLLFLLWRLSVIALFPYDLYADEAQYWFWAQQLDWGYYSKPPMIAWLIAATTAVCGDGLFCVKLAAPFLYASTGLLLFALARRWYAPPVGLYTVLLFNLLPAIGLGSLMITTDAPLLFFWALALFALVRALEQKPEQWLWWLILGGVCGLGLLSKYTMAAFALSTGLVLIFHQNGRQWLWRPQPWIAAGVASIIYLPNAIWNARQDWISYRHTQEISQLDRARWSWEGLGEFMLSQFVVFGPFLFGILLLLLFFRWKVLWADRHTRLLLLFIVPWFAVVAILALASRVHANWSMPIYLAASILLAAWLSQRTPWRNGLLVMTLSSHLLFAAGMYHYHDIRSFLGIPWQAKLDPYLPLRGWNELSQTVINHWQDYPDALILTEQRRVSAHLAYHLKTHDYFPPHFKSANLPFLIKWNPENLRRDHFDLTTTLEGLEGRDFILVSRGHAVPQDLPIFFAHIELLEELSIPLAPDASRDFELLLLRGLQR